MGDIGEGGHTLSKLLTQLFENGCAGAVELDFQRRLDRWPLINAAHQNLCLRVLSVDFLLQASNELIGLVLVSGQHEGARPARHAFHVGAQVVIKLGRALAD